MTVYWKQTYTCDRMADSWAEKQHVEKRTHMGYVWISVCSVFEGLQIIYSPFRRRELFSFDRFIRRRSGRAIAPRNIDGAYIHGPSRLFFFFLPFSISFSLCSRPWLARSPGRSLRLGVLKNEPGHYFYAALQPGRGPPPPPFRSNRDSSDRGPVLLAVVSAGTACNVPHQRMCKN